MNIKDIIYLYKTLEKTAVVINAELIIDSFSFVLKRNNEKITFVPYGCEESGIKKNVFFVSFDEKQRPNAICYKDINEQMINNLLSSSSIKSESNEKKRICPKQYFRENINCIIETIDEALGCSLELINSKFHMSNDDIYIIPVVSKKIVNRAYDYWYTYHDYQRNELLRHKKAYFALLLADIDEMVLIPSKEIEKELNKLSVSTDSEGNMDWQIYIVKNKDDIFLHLAKIEDISLNAYLYSFGKGKQIESDNILRIHSRNFKVIKGKKVSAK